MKNKKILVTSLLLSIFLFSSCNTSKNIVYLQDVVTNTPADIDKGHEITIMPKDVIMIAVSSRDESLAALFNLTLVTNIGSGGSYGGTRLLGYTVDPKGNIDFPVLGSLSVGGLTRKQISDLIKERLISDNLIKDPVVTVEFMNMKINVLGEVKNPGSIPVLRDQITLLEAISLAGDLTIYGKRDGIYVIREENNTRITYQVDIRSSSLFTSPVYYLQQNDVVYVEPNSVKAGQSTINENSLRSVSMWMSIISFVATLSVLIFK